MVGTAEDTPSRPDRAARGAASFRPDIDGLRAVAILVIVAFHVGLPGFTGGFIGVDVFFVISGYLITQRLIDGDTSVHLLTFWGKRIRRLVPALGLMVLVTLTAAYVILPSIAHRQVAKEGAASAAYVSNIFFARASQNYFGADVAESPFLHTWSLGVEEQFYLVWPFLVALGAFGLRRVAKRQHALAGLFLVVLIGSFVLNLRLTDEQSTWAFFSLPTRAWEFALAGLLALVGARWVPGRALTRTAISLLGVGLLIWATLTFSGDTPYPGWAALVPVFATVLLLISGDAQRQGASFVNTSVFSLPPIQWIGRLSYSWYLWHWPFIILTIAALDEDKIRYRAGAALASLVVAYGAYRLIENPLRFSPRLKRSIPRTYVVGGAVTVVALVAAALLAVTVTTPKAGSLDEQLAAAPKLVFPCLPTKSPSGIPYCAGGGGDGTQTVLLVGDSHAGMWMDAVGRVAKAHNTNLAIATAPGCPAINVATKVVRQGQLTPSECRKRHNDLLTLVDELHPRAVLIAQTNAYVGSLLDSEDRDAPDSEQLSLWRDAFQRTISDLRQRGVAVGVILNNPSFDASPLTCIARERAVDPCVPTRDQALQLVGKARAVDAAVTSDEGVPTYDPVDQLCDDHVCMLQLENGALVYADDNHLTNAATLWMQPQIERLWQQTAPG